MNKFYKILLKIILILIGLFMIIPFIYMIFTSFKVTYTAYNFTYSLTDLTLDNYIDILSKGKFTRYFINSTIITMSGVFLNLLFSSLAAFSFAKLEFKGNDKIFFFLVLTLIIPSQVTMVPLFSIMIKLDWVNTFKGLILPIPTAFGIFLLRQAIIAIPNEVIEAARLDGASNFKIYYKIILPMIKPAMSALFIFTFIAAWNEFLWPLIMSPDGDYVKTLSVGLANLGNKYTVNYGIIMAGATISFIPSLLFYLILQSKFVEGISSYSLKG
ncbi:MAG: sugar ABC transporter permease [Clostridiales bacterium]|nr:MAG: sugar ABC transporter permease [Clostridiales bacterium]